MKQLLPESFGISAGHGTAPHGGSTSDLRRDFRRPKLSLRILSRIAKMKRTEDGQEDLDPFALADVDRDGFVSRREFQDFVNDPLSVSTFHIEVLWLL